MKERSFFSKHITNTLIIAFSSILVAGIFPVLSLNKFYNNDFLERQLKTTSAISSVVPEHGFETIEAAQKFADNVSSESLFRVTIMTFDGSVIADSHKEVSLMDNHSNRPEIIEASYAGQGSDSRISVSIGEHLLYTASRLNQQELYIRLAIPSENIINATKSVVIRILIILVLVLVIAFYFTYRETKNITSIIKKVDETCSSYASGDFSKPLTLAGFREASKLASDISIMGKKLRKTIGKMEFQQNKLQTILNQMNDPVISIDRRSRVKEINQAALSFIGKTKKKAIGKEFFRLYENLDLMEIIEESFENETNAAKLLQFEHDKIKYMQVNCLPVFNIKKELNGMVIVMNDITEIQSLHIRQKMFVSNVSHELKTPITAISGFLDTLLEYPDLSSEKRNEMISITLEQSLRLHTIIEDLLLLASLEEERVTISKDTFPLLPLLNDAKKVCSISAKQRGIDIEIYCEKDLELSAHYGLIEQAVINYLNNAIKYSEEGGIVKVKAKQDGNKISISVKDKGQGIPTDKVSHLFERFYRVDKARSRDKGGTGLGLSIVKHIAERHGGTVFAKSRVGKGSKFEIILPR